MSSVFPSSTGWITPRTTEVQLDSNNCQIILNQKIEKIDKVYLNAEVIHFAGTQLRMVQSGASIESGPEQYLSDFFYDEALTMPVKFADITQWVVEENKWKTLQALNLFTVDDKIYKNNTFYYKQHTNTIELPNNRIGGWVLDNEVYLNIILSLKPFLPDLYIYHDSLTQKGVAKLTGYRASSINNKLMSAQFRVYYTPLGESVKLQTPKTIPVAREFAIPFSQQQPMVDNVSHGRGMQSTSNRIGCETKQIIRVFHSIKEYRRPGVAFYEKDANGNRTGAIWRLTECNLKIYSDTMYRVVETWSKNWTLRSENVPLNREFRSWNIPADIVQRDLYYQDYCVLSKRPLAFDQTGMFFSDEAKQELFRGLTPTKNSKRTECTNMIFFRPHPTLENSKIGAVINASAFGFGNSLVFTGKTQDNLSAGVQRVAKDDSDKNYQFCKDVYYCNDDGTLPHMHIELCAALQTSEGLENAASYRYPEATLVAIGSGVYYLNIADDTNGVRLLNQYEFDIRKDPSEQLNFTYQLHLMTTEPELIIGTTWAAENGLVKERETAPTIKTWTLNKTLPGGAQAMTEYYGDVTTNSGVCTVNIANGTIKFSPPANTVGVVLTDEYNNILVAYNGTTEATYTAYYTHDYSALAKATRQANS